MTDVTESQSLYTHLLLRANICQAVDEEGRFCVNELLSFYIVWLDSIASA